MISRPVPVTLGSPRFSSATLDGCAVVHAWFPPDTTLESHTHDRATVAVMLAGSFDLRFTGREYACMPACISVEPAGARHLNRMHGAGAEVLVLQPDASRDDLWRPFAQWLGEIGWQRHAGIAGLAARVTQEVRSPDAYSSLVMEALVLEIFVAAARLSNASRRRGASPPWLLRAQELLHDRPTTPMSIRNVAVECGVHPAHLAREFRRHFRVSIGAYARGLRVEWAARQLADTTKPIAVIAAEGGFADQSHLTRLLKRGTGLTPEQYRTAVRGKK
jgi:AraC family transcriptional regulator